jgi:LmbE family N-acetylglucosaminyl deacetylase
VRRFLVPFARRVTEANLLARAVLRRDADLVLPPRVAPAPRRPLVVAPHPDDEAIGCGGVLALAADATVVFLTADGGRRAEAEAACSLLGVRRVEFAGHVDGRVPDDGPAVESLRALVVGAAPDCVLVPWPLERQRDHAAAARLTGRALAGTDVPLWCYEVWSPLDPDVLVDIGAVVDRKRAAIDAHASQVAALPYADAALGLNRYRSLLAPGSSHAEAFLTGDAASVLRLAGAG